MVLYYLTLSTDAILIIIQHRAALLAFTVNDLFSTRATVASVSVDLCFLIQELVKSLLKLTKKLSFLPTSIYLLPRILFLTHSLFLDFTNSQTSAFF